MWSERCQKTAKEGRSTHHRLQASMEKCHWMAKGEHYTLQYHHLQASKERCHWTTEGECYTFHHYLQVSMERCH